MSSSVTTGCELVERMGEALLLEDRSSSSIRPDSRAPSSGRSGRAAPRAAGTCPRTRSGSPSRAGGTGRAARASTPSTVTCRSAIASSSADCVFGVARLISSTSTTFAKIGPGPELEVARLLVEDREPGDVRRLEVGRALDARRACALDGAARSSGRARSSPCPGTSSSRTWPPHMSAARTSLISSRLPWTTVSMLSSRRAATSIARAKRSAPSGASSGSPPA